MAEEQAEQVVSAVYKPASPGTKRVELHREKSTRQHVIDGQVVTQLVRRDNIVIDGKLVVSDPELIEELDRHPARGQTFVKVGADVPDDFKKVKVSKEDIARIEAAGYQVTKVVEGQDPIIEHEIGDARRGDEVEVVDSLADYDADLAEADAAIEAASELTKADIIAELADRGVEAPARATKGELVQLLIDNPSEEAQPE